MNKTKKNDYIFCSGIQLVSLFLYSIYMLIFGKLQSQSVVVPKFWSYALAQLFAQ